MAKKNILIVHLNSNGDCLFTTIIAKQIKEVDYPDCNLTWAISSRCRQTILLNPHVNEIWEIPTKKSLASEQEWNDIVTCAEQRKAAGDFDKIFYIQLILKNALKFDGGIRSSTYNNYPHKITVSHQPVIRLSETEVNRVKEFAKLHLLHNYKQVILVECGPESFKSFLNPTSMLKWAIKIISLQKDVAIILSSNKAINSPVPSIIDGSVLSFRENAELTKHCSLFIGCSSGISWLTTTDWAKPLPKIIITNYNYWLFSSMIYDHQNVGLSVNEIIEMNGDKTVLQRLHNCTLALLNGSFSATKKQYYQPFKIKNYSFIYRLCRDSFKRMEFISPLPILKRSFERNGFSLLAILYVLKAYLKIPFQFLIIGFKAITHRKNSQFNLKQQQP